MIESSSRPRISFIVPVHNRLDCTKPFLASLYETLAFDDWELIFVDDCSENDTVEYLDSLKDSRIHIIHNEERRGYAKSMNRAVQGANSELLGLLNNDLVLKPGWIEPMLDCYENCLKVGAVGNIQRNIETKALDHAGILFDAMGLPDHYAKNFPFIFPFQYRDFAGVTGACLFIKKKLFDQLDGFNEKYINGCEDVDLCLRIKQAGFRNIVAGKSEIWHHVSASPGRHDKDKLNNKNLLLDWGHLTIKYGEKNWPFQYVVRHWNCPWRINGPKLIDAVLRLLKLKSGDSSWAKKKRNETLAFDSESI